MLRALSVSLCLAALAAPACDDASRADRAEARAEDASNEFGERLAAGEIAPDELGNELKRLALLAAEARTARAAADAAAADTEPEPAPEPPQAPDTPPQTPPDEPSLSPLDAARAGATARAAELERLYTDLATTLRRIAEAEAPDSQRVQRTIDEIDTIPTDAARILGSLRRSIASDQLFAVISAGGRATRLAGPLRAQIEAAQDRLRAIQPGR